MKIAALPASQAPELAAGSRAALDPVKHPTSALSSVLIVDESDLFRDRLGRSFQKMGFEVWLSADVPTARTIVSNSAPGIVVTELRLDGRWAFDLALELKERRPDARTVIATGHPSIATAVKAVTSGFDGYVVKPVDANLIIELLQRPSPFVAGDTAETAAWPTLDRTIWEYVNQVFVSAGSMTEAAKRLGLHRRSLRRMLAKCPPAR